MTDENKSPERSNETSRKIKNDYIKIDNYLDQLLRRMKNAKNDDFKIKKIKISDDSPILRLIKKHLK